MRTILGLWLVILGSAGVYAQSNTFIDQVMTSPSIRVDEASYLILVASDNLSDDADATRAFEFLTQLGWAPSGIKADTRISYAEFDYLLMNAFGIEGSLWYRLFPSPRYAYREMRTQVVVQGATDPDMPVSGAAAMRMIGRIFDVKGVQE